MNGPARSPEFPAGASASPDALGRRDFLRLAGATLSLAGLTAGCDRPAKTLVPYVAAPDGLVPGVKQFYATAMPWQGYARGILVESHEGRPTKIEGNPRHPESRGATDAVTQAAIRALYDPDRSRAPRRAGLPSDWASFEREWQERRRQLQANGGAGWALLTEPSSSPSLERAMRRLLAQFPAARWYQFSALPAFQRAGQQADLQIERADVILAIDSDFLFQHPAALRYGREFASRRRLKGGREKLNRLYVIETGRTVTGGMADVRLPLAPSRLPRILAAIDSGSVAGLERAEAEFVQRVSRDLAAAGPGAVCTAGPEQAERVQHWVEGRNRRSGAIGQTVRMLPAGLPETADAAALLAELKAGRVKTLCCLGVNPVYATAPHLGWAEAVSRVEWSLHMGELADETAAATQWHLPESHFLEAWGDGRGFDGTGIIQQPLIEPLYESRSSLEVIHYLTDEGWTAGFDLVRATHAVSDEVWQTWLNDGAAEFEMKSEVERDLRARLATNRVLTATLNEARERPEVALHPLELDSDQLEIVIRPDGFLWDGRFANNAWLQELPRPYTSLVWDNALWIGPAFARRHGLATGDLIQVNVNDVVTDVPVVIVPGVADGCAMAELGGGRRLAGQDGLGRGFNAFRFQDGSEAGPWLAQAKWAKTGRTYPLVTTQHHFTMDGREPVHVVAWTDVGRAPSEEPLPGSLYPARPAAAPKWGMVIDLASCLGCSACVAACQAENNIPSVGKDAVSRGREMHWIRLDRYFGPDDQAWSQPVPCMHCENAPCEAVCPVGATVHSTEGLNEMVYNRCVGTRYCSNNCPYKVRRFNFFDLKAPPASTLHLQENPSVTVRDRGVMEKCSYCVQRIDAGRIAADRENRPLRDGEIRTACQQACPAEAIVFGDLIDPQSAVSRRKAEKTNYSLLAELNTRPRTTYLAKVTNA